MNNIGPISLERRGRELHLRCNNCGSEETVTDFETSGQPRHFGLSGLGGSGDEAFAKCHHCLMVHDRSQEAVPVSRGRRRLLR